MENLPDTLLGGGGGGGAKHVELMRIFDGSCVLQAGAGDEACSSSNPTAGYAINATLLPPRAQIALFGAIFIEKRSFCQDRLGIDTRKR